MKNSSSFKFTCFLYIKKPWTGLTIFVDEQLIGAIKINAQHNPHGYNNSFANGTRK